MREVPVLVVGGALTGLSAAVFLGVHGVPSLVLERRDDILAHPRLRGLLPRAVEVYRQAGLERAILDRCPTATPRELVSVSARTLAEEHRPLSEVTAGEPTDARSPCAFAPIAQDELEHLLVDRARSLGARVLFGVELVALAQDADWVTARVRSRCGAEDTVRARYAIAADGASSGVRRALGIASRGPGTLFRMATMHVRADLSPALRGRRIGMAYLGEPAPGTTLGPLDDSGEHWFFGTARPDRCDADPAAWVRAATGLPDLDVELLEQVPGSGTKVFTFPIGARLARDYGRGRVFLAGDAAHLMPPTGGLGGLTAVEDAHNLAWKLALVLRGAAGPRLAATYEAERRPVAERATAQALARARVTWRLPDLDTEPAADIDSLVFGNRYTSTAVPGSTGSTPVPPFPAGTPGTRAPHVYVDSDDDTGLSTLDLYGTDPVLLVGSAGDRWATAVHRAAGLLDVAVEVYHLDPDVAEQHNLGPRGALLVRPDGYCAWYARDVDGDPDRVAEDVLRALLDRDPHGSPFPQRLHQQA